MTTYNSAIALAKELVEKDSELKEKPTKKLRLELRNTLNNLKKAVTDAKKDLMIADKGQ